MQIFNESWRQMRDFFYSPIMNGVDWKAMHDKYAVLVPYVNHRADLDYIIGELIGELNSGHTYVSGGDIPRHEKLNTGLLGASFRAMQVVTSALIKYWKARTMMLRFVHRLMK